MVSKLFCAIVDVGDVVAVDIDVRNSACDVKEKIQQKILNYSGFHSILSNKLYFARRGNTWLTSGDNDIKAVKRQRREVPDGIKELMYNKMMLEDTVLLGEDGCFGKNLMGREIHLLVKLPDLPDSALYYAHRVEWVMKAKIVALVGEFGFVVFAACNERISSRGILVGGAVCATLTALIEGLREYYLSKADVCKQPNYVQIP